MKTSLRLLIIEDSEFDAQMMVSLLRKEGYQITYCRVETAESMKKALSQERWDLILADYNLPDFNALAALLFNVLCANISKKPQCVPGREQEAVDSKQKAVGSRGEL